MSEIQANKLTKKVLGGKDKVKVAAIQASQ